MQQLAYEKESLGLYFSGHPIDRVAAELKGFGAKTTAELGAMGTAGATGLPTEAAQAAQVGANEGGSAPSAANGYRREQGRRRRHWRHHRVDPAAEDAQGRSHGGHHARRSARQRRSGGVSGGVRKCASVLEAGAMVVVKGKVELDEETHPDDGERGAADRGDAAEDVARAVDQAHLAAARTPDVRGAGGSLRPPSWRSARGAGARAAGSAAAAAAARAAGRRTCACVRRSSWRSEVERICGAGTVVS